MTCLTRPSYTCLPSFFFLGHGSNYTFPPSSFLTSFQFSLHLSCEDYNSQSALLLPLEQGRLGMPCPAASFSIGKGRETGWGPLSWPKPPAARVVPSGLVPCHCQVVQPSTVQWMGREEEERGSQPGCLGSGSAWGPS